MHGHEPTYRMYASSLGMRVDGYLLCRDAETRIRHSCLAIGAYVWLLRAQAFAEPGRGAERYCAATSNSAYMALAA